jgi:hypothetical protein
MTQGRFRQTTHGVLVKLLEIVLAELHGLRRTGENSDKGLLDVRWLSSHTDWELSPQSADF